MDLDYVCFCSSSVGSISSPSSVKNHSRFAVAHCVSSAITLHTGGFIAGMGSKTRSVEIFRVYNRSGNSQTVELSLITFVRDVTNPSSLLPSFQQVEEMSVDGICVSLERRFGVDDLFFFVENMKFEKPRRRSGGRKDAPCSGDQSSGALKEENILNSDEEY